MSYPRTYANMYGKQTAEHIDSDNWENNGRVMRIHRFRCKICGGEYIYAERLYDNCPYCAYPIYHGNERAF